MNSCKRTGMVQEGEGNGNRTSPPPSAWLQEAGPQDCPLVLLILGQELPLL